MRPRSSGRWLNTASFFKIEYQPCYAPPEHAYLGQKKGKIKEIMDEENRERSEDAGSFILVR
jgi:hypothetical protein